MITKADFEKLAKQNRQPKPSKVATAIWKRITGALSNQRTRARKEGKEVILSLEEARELVFEAYGRPCYYCNYKITHTKSNSFSLDHIFPVSEGGELEKRNMMIICRKCNKRKDIISSDNFSELMGLIGDWPGNERRSILTRLSVGGMHFKRKETQ